MIFVTVGSQKFQFDRLVRAVDALVASGVAEDGSFLRRVCALTFLSIWNTRHFSIVIPSAFIWMLAMSW